MTLSRQSSWIYINVMFIAQVLWGMTGNCPSVTRPCHTPVNDTSASNVDEISNPEVDCTRASKTSARSSRTKKTKNLNIFRTRNWTLMSCVPQFHRTRMVGLPHLHRTPMVDFPRPYRACVEGLARPYLAGTMVCHPRP